MIDRRDNPSHGYRAVHIIAEISGKPIEIQVRSSLQHLWAEVSEKSSDVLDPSIKYGGGTDLWRDFLTKSSEEVAAYEKWEKAHFKTAAASEVMVAAYEEFKKAVAELEVMVAAYEKFKKAVAKLPGHHLSDQQVQEIRGKLEEATREMERAEQEDQENRDGMVRVWNVLADLFSEAISWLVTQKRQKQ